MPITVSTNQRSRLLLASLLAILLASCARVPPPPTQPYAAPAEEASPTRLSAVDSLQQEADLALQRRDFASAIETLQRAIRLEPRNPYSWHYLGLTYYEMGDFARCRAMAERSSGFSTVDDTLQAANERLQNRCAPD